MAKSWDGVGIGDFYPYYPNSLGMFQTFAVLCSVVLCSVVYFIVKGIVLHYIVPREEDQAPQGTPDPWMSLHPGDPESPPGHAVWRLLQGYRHVPTWIGARLEGRQYLTKSIEEQNLNNF